MDQGQMVLYFFVGVIGLIALATLHSIFKKSSRKKIYRGFAGKHNLSFSEKIKIPRFSAVGQVFSASFKEAAEKRRLSQTPGFNKETAKQKAAQTRQQSLALKNVPQDSILSDPLFYNVHKTDSIFHYCEGQHQGYSIELFDELRVHTVRRRSTDSTRLKSAHTELSFKLTKADIPSFFISPLTGSKVENHPNRIHLKGGSGFDDHFALVSDSSEPAVVDQINHLLTTNALSGLMALSPVHLQAKGQFVRFSKRFPDLNENDLDLLFEQCLVFVENLVLE